ncbi:aminotransferase class I/II-fold pyridoxal phosphate-dependent enzyme [Thermohalobacter berrensis]|uniref:Aluminum resistance family protein n=1 Tax=Thermohalobacter berrensis TaxID=99594 RepID=A0A419TAL3_9FIRM|nr:methionine gamma-lyase family protein [Thermohalobacter berrensis]RKD34510.1 hypothetical protein BET03_01375 [Thermohalobacter berrensis]
MDKETVNILCKHFGADKKVIDYILKKEKTIKHKFTKIDKIKEYNHYKILSSMQKARLDSTHFNWTTGYGYNDVGRKKVEEIYSYVFNTEDALVRPTIVSGTHALTLAISGILRPGDEILSITGSPYDTLQKVIGIKGTEKGSLKEYGITYREVDLNDKGAININEALKAINDNTKLILIQRSTGYSDRKAITIDEIKRAIHKIKNYRNNLICMVDNCYGEFIEKKEPTDVGADLAVGSLIKNPGGGLALTGGYIVGKKCLIEQIANRSTAPGIGKECGLTFGNTRNVLQGLFLAPHVVAGALKGAILAATVFKGLGFRVIPDIQDIRSDIIQGVELKSKERVIKFCEGIQQASPVDSYFTPQPWDMPGYDDQVIMAAGAFIQGSSIELSADAPIKEPYLVYFQGGLTYEHSKIGIIKAINNLYINNLVKIK